MGYKTGTAILQDRPPFDTEILRMFLEKLAASCNTAVCFLYFTKPAPKGEWSEVARCLMS